MPLQWDYQRKVSYITGTGADSRGLLPMLGVVASSTGSCLILPQLQINSGTLAQQYHRFLVSKRTSPDISKPGEEMLRSSP